MALKHPAKSPNESSIRLEAEDKELRDMQRYLSRFLVSGKSIIELDRDPPPPFFVDPKNGEA